MEKNEAEEIVIEEDLEKDVEKDLEKMEEDLEETNREKNQLEKVNEKLNNLMNAIEEKKKNKGMKQIEEKMGKLEKKISEDDDLSLKENVVYGPTTKIQYNGSSHMVTIPRKMTKKFNLAKGDELKWIETDFHGESVMMLTVERKENPELRPPLEERDE